MCLIFSSTISEQYNANLFIISDTKLGAGAIAAIVVGIVIFIILVVIIVIFTVKRCKQKESYDLPTYRGGGIWQLMREIILEQNRLNLWNTLALEYSSKSSSTSRSEARSSE